MLIVIVCSVDVIVMVCRATVLSLFYNCILYGFTLQPTTCGIVRSSRDDKMARSTFLATGKTTRKDSATCPANSGSVSEPSNTTFERSLLMHECCT